MAVINFAHREITAKVVYFGAAGAGTNTNVHRLFEHLEVGEKSRLHRFGPDNNPEETTYFDYVPRGGGLISGFSTRFRVYSMPGALSDPAHRIEIMRAVDAVAFVADARTGRGRANTEALLELEGSLKNLSLEMSAIPMVFQVNHTDATQALSPDQVAYDLNPYGFPVIPATAHTGRGVLETHESVILELSQRIRDNLAGNQTSITLTAVHRAEPERDEDVIRNHLAAIQRAHSDYGDPVYNQEIVLADGDNRRYRDLDRSHVVELPFQPRAMLGKHPVHVLETHVEGDRVHVDIICDKLSGGNPEFVRVTLVNRPIDVTPAPRLQATSTAAAAPRDVITASLPDKIEFLSPAPSNDLPPVAYGLFGLIGGGLVGLLLGYLVLN